MALIPDLGLALSGGGSRAAAFHCGTITALLDLDLVERVKVVSTVSGGSVFGAAWMAHRAKQHDDRAFLEKMRGVLARGFIKPALRDPRVLLVPFPGYTRTQLLAHVFDQLLFQGVGLADLPVAPLLCLNTAVLNHAMPGRFSRNGYSGEGVGPYDPTATSYPEVALRGVSLGFATACSAAFPFGLPPLEIRAGQFTEDFTGKLANDDRLVLTDGGVLENLGVERLLRSGRFGARHIVVSDAGVKDVPWRPTLLGRLKSLFIYALAPSTLERLLLMMNDKQNKSMRELAYARVDRSLATDRCVLFVRVNQNWNHVVGQIPTWRLDELGISLPANSPVATIEAALAATGIDLSAAKALYVGEQGVKAANAISTNFTGLDAKELDLLDKHARWQVHAMHALYGGKL